VVVVVVVHIPLIVHLLHVAFIVARTNAPSKAVDEAKPFQLQIKLSCSHILR